MVYGLNTSDLFLLCFCQMAMLLCSSVAWSNAFGFFSVYFAYIFLRDETHVNDEQDSSNSACYRIETVQIVCTFLKET